MRERLRLRLRGKKVLKSAAVKPSVSNMTTSSEVRPAPSPPDWRQRGEEWIREEYENKVLQRVNKFKGHGKQKVPRFYKSLHNNPHMEWKKRLKRKEVEMRRWKEWNEWKKQFLYWKHKFSFPVPYMEWLRVNCHQTILKRNFFLLCLPYFYYCQKTKLLWLWYDFMLHVKKNSVGLNIELSSFVYNLVIISFTYFRKNKVVWLYFGRNFNHHISVFAK